MVNLKCITVKQKPDTKGYTLYNSIYMIFGKGKIIGVENKKQAAKG